MTLLLSFLAALSALIILVTFVQTLVAYPALPDRVALNFTWSGVPARFYARPMIWFGVAVQLFAACVMAYADYAIATHAPNTHGTLLGSMVASVPVLAILWRAQSLFIACAKSGGKTVPMASFYAFLFVGMGIVVLDVILIG